MAKTIVSLLAFGLSLILLLGLVACDPKPVTGDGSTSPGQNEVKQLTEVTTGPTVPLTVLPSVTASPSDELAPPYFEIRQTVREIVNPANPDAGPVVNDDGIVDPDIRKAFGDYQYSLVGKRIEGWEGWVVGCTSTDYGNLETNYNLAITMQEPIAGTRAQTHVLVYAYPRDKALQLSVCREAASDSQKGFSLCSGPCQRITFSGFVSGIQDDGRVYVDIMELQAVE
jgi:hypothetical protein